MSEKYLTDLIGNLNYTYDNRTRVRPCQTYTSHDFAMEIVYILRNENDKLRNENDNLYRTKDELTDEYNKLVIDYNRLLEENRNLRRKEKKTVPQSKPVNEEQPQISRNTFGRNEISQHYTINGNPCNIVNGRYESLTSSASPTSSASHTSAPAVPQPKPKIERKTEPECEPEYILRQLSRPVDKSQPEEEPEEVELN